MPYDRLDVLGLFVRGSVKSTPPHLLEVTTPGLPSNLDKAWPKPSLVEHHPYLDPRVVGGSERVQPPISAE
jgi:hypothetical protein